MTDQRVHPRFHAKEGAIAAVKPHSEVLGQIIDVSIGGLSFQYIDKHFDTQTNGRLLILFTEADFLLDEIPFQTVADFKITEPNRFSSLTMRRRCVRFKRLTENQTEVLSHFILRHTLITSAETQLFGRQKSYLLSP